MTLADLNVWLDYHYWARDVLLEAVAPLSSEQFTRPVESSFKSVRDTVAHIYAADLVWYKRWNGETAGLVAYDRFPDLASIRTAWTDLEGRARAFVNGLGEDGVNRRFDYRLLSGVADTAPFWEMLVHVVNHATYHRGQVTTLLRQLGAAPPRPMDMIAFFRTRR
jgi:uncharacterized damage-inducible protein DinB